MTNRSKMQKAMLLLGVFVVFATFATDLMAQCNENAPQVGGAIYGGGRKANVNGKSVIHVNETKPRTQVSDEGCGKYTPAIGGVYGGNDIAGCVLHADGSTITIGNASSNKCVSIGEVYGGGNGYYSYPSSTYTNGQEQGFGDLAYDAAKTGEGAVKLWNKGSVNSDDVLVETLSESLMIPRIKKTSVTIQGTNTYVDSVFGGSKNAYTEKDAAYADDDVIATINVNNGVVGAVFGGNNYGGTIGGAPFAGLTQAPLNATMAKINININGSLLAPNESDLLCYGTSYGVGTVFGGGNKVTAPNVVLTISGGQVDTLFAGGNSASVLSSSIVVNHDGYTGSCESINDGNYDVRCLFAGNNAAPMKSLPTVTLTRGHVHTLYGGGNAGDMKAEEEKTVEGVNIKASTNVLINAADDNDNLLVIDEVYGGCQKANVDHSTYVEMNHGTVGTIYGGCNISGTVGFAHSNSADNAAGGSTYVVLNGGTICHDVFGGSNGAYACVDADGKYGETPFDVNSDYHGLALPKVNSTHVFAQGAAVSGNIYGGGNMAPVGDATSYGGNANVELKSGTVNNAFAGGRMANVYGFATIFTPSSVAADALTVRNIFGGNDISGNVSNVASNSRGNSIAGATAVDGYQVVLNGANAASYVKIEGAPTIEGSVFGGGNGDYDYDGNNVYVKGSAHNDANKVATLCGSSTDDDNKPTQSSTFVDVNINGGTIASVFGGGNAADVTNAVTHINGAETHGTVARAFAGGNSATAVGSATIAVNGTQGTNLNVRTVFGGNNQAEMGIVPNVALTSGKVDTVYGGGNAGNMTGSNNDGNSTYVEINSSNIQVQEVYGGCNAADVAHNTMVDMKLGTVTGNIYGGNNVSGTVGSSDQGGIAIVNLNGGTVSGNVFGGSNGDYGCTDANGAYTGGLYQGMTLPVSTGTKVVVEGNASITGNIYGGGNMAPVGNSTNNGNAIVELTSGTVSGNAFAGGRMASVNGFATIYTTSSSNITITNVFGGNDIAGSVNNSGDAPRPEEISGAAAGKAFDRTTNLDASNSASYVRIDGSPNITNVYGGGNGDYTYTVADGKTHVTGTNTDVYLCNATGESNKPIQSSTFVDIMSDGGAITNAFGGGNAADVTNAVTHINGEATHGTIATAYAGGNSATVTASATIVLNATANSSENNFNVTTIFGGNNQAPMDIVPTVTLTEGRADVVYGGGNAGNMTANVDGKSTYIEVNSDDVYVNEIYGGCNAANVSNNSVVNMQEGHVGTIYGGNNVSGTISGQTLVTLAGGEVTGNVFGGSNGDYGCNDGSVYTSGIYSTPTPKTLPVSNATKVVVDGDCEISGSIYGGGNMAPVGTSASNNGNAVVELTSGNVTGNAFAGGRMADVYGFATIYTTATSSIYINNVYGGNDIAGSVSNGTSNARTSTIGNGATTTLDGTVALTGANAASYVQILGNPVIGNVFGGGNGDYTYKNRKVYPSTISADEVTNETPSIVTLCGDAGKPEQSSTFVDIKTSAGTIANVFGGGNAADVATALTHINGEATHGTITTAYAGGNSATVTSSASLKLNASNGNADGATDNVTTIFGGNNLAVMNIVPTLDLVSGKASEVYGGGNAGNMICTNDPNNRSTYVNIASANVNLGTVYGGCKAADVSEDAVVEMSNGTVGTIYGGNNISGTIATTTKVTLTGGTVTGDVFGGSNGNYGCNNGTIYTEGDAVSTYDNKTIPVTKKTLVRVQGANVAGNVYGGGHMAPVGTPEQGTVGQDGYVAAAGSAVVQLVSGTVTGSAFAGGRMAPVYGSSTVNFPESSSITIGSVFAGNDIANTSAAARTANGVVTVKGHPHITNVFAGGNGDYVYDFDNHTVVAYGETLSICDLQKPNVNSGTVNVQMDDNAAGLIVNVYGGANAADVTTNTTVNMTTGKVTNLFGGNNITGNINGTATVNLVGGDVTNVFGGSNGDYGCNDGARYTDGDHAGEQLPTVANTVVNVNVTGTMGSESKPISIYGGGNMAPVGSAGSGSTSVVLNTGNIIGSAYAGGRMASVNGFATISTPSTSTIHITNVFGGNDIAGSVNPEQGAVRNSNSMGDALPSMVALTAANAASYVKIEGNPVITNVYGGGNGDYDYTNGAVYKKGSDHTDANKVSSNYCDQNYSKPELSASFVDIKLNDAGSVTNVFGGGNAAEVTRAITHINDNNDGSHGTIATAYAGGNAATVTSSAEILLNAEHAQAEGSLNVTTIFGGNNLADMSIIPQVNLVKGKAETVYGGGNQGAMLADVTINGVEHKSTHIEIKSQNIEVATVYGGCNAANVAKGTYINVSAGKVDRIFGGNDVSGDAKHAYVMIHDTNINSTPVRPQIGTIYGGSNGMYYYDNNNVYDYNTHSILVGTGDRAMCDSAETYVWGGNITGNIYGGGLAGNGSATYLEIGDGNTQAPTVNGNIYGAGCGNTDEAAINSCQPHLGNISGLSITEVKGLAAGSNTDEIYGGGHAGDVHNTQLTIHSTVESRFGTIYGGGYAGDITGTATTNVMGSSVTGNTANVVYGGNNYGGWVNNTELNIYNGTYDWIYGAGNGEYKYRDIYREKVCESDNDTVGYKVWQHPCVVPYSNNIVLNLYNPTVNNNVYGGGNLGVVGKDYTSEVNDTRDASDYVTNTPVTYRDQSLPTEYGSIVTNIYGGTYLSHVFAGARGRDAVDEQYGKWIDFYGRRQLAFAYKQVNMYDGYIRQSLYGGSEYIDDGYPFECTGKNTYDAEGNVAVKKTTMRPTTVVNMMGGTVNKNLYGGGYLGNIYGSVFVNIGEKAVDTCYVWNKSYDAGLDGETFKSYMPFKPELHSANLYVNASVYNGSDWGEAGANSVFNTPGFYGGESQLFLDGEGYETSSSSVSSGKPFMNIKYSLMGAGTSTEGGDCRRQIIVRNYGSYNCPVSSRAFYSIQRADRVIIENSYFALQGEQDAYTAYPSPDYTFNRIDTLIFRRQNVVTIANPANYIGVLRSETSLTENTIGGSTKAHFWTDGKTDYRMAPVMPAASLVDGAVDCSGSAGYANCGGETESNRIVMNEGTYFKVLAYVPYEPDNGENSNQKYGPVEGYMYMVSGDKTKSYVYARMKTTTTQDAINPGDGGFVGLCSSQNKTVIGEYSTEGQDTQSFTDSQSQISYENAHLESDKNYRVWYVGTIDGIRKRHITIVANAAVAKSDNGQYHVPGCFNNFIYKDNVIDPNNNQVIHNGTHSADNTAVDEQFAVAYGTLQLPPSAANHWYDIQSMKIDADNEQVKLVETAFNEYLNTPETMETSDWLKLKDATNGTTERQLIAADPSYTFGLMFQVGENFSKESTASGSSHTVLVGGDNFASLNGFRTKPVNISSASGVIPELQFALTYSTKFGNTIIRDVVFEMMEYEPCDECQSRKKEVGMVEVTVTIATVISDFVDVEVPLMAMYNEGRRNTYSRKIIIPASFERRNLTLQSVGWQFDNRYKYSNEYLQTQLDHYNEQHQDAQIDPNDVTAVRQFLSTLVDPYGSEKFYLQSSAAEIDDAQHFGISLDVSENVSDNTANSLGWYDITNRHFDVFAQTGLQSSVNAYNVGIPSGTEPNITWDDFHIYDRNSGKPMTTPSLKVPLTNPLRIGSLDGRATAALDVSLHFNGTKLYEDNDTLGYVYLNMTYIGKNNVPHDYKIRLRIWSRESGDTIYVASRPGTYGAGGMYTRGSFSRDLNVANPVVYHEADPNGDKQKYGKEPNSYLVSMSDAMRLYKAGDVICALDTIILDDDMNFTLNGTDFSEIEVIRYSGSHSYGPGLENAYYGPMFKITDGAKFKALNCIFNGSGFTRTWGTKNDVDWRHHVSAVNGSQNPHGDADNVDHDQVEGRWSAIMFAQAPIFVVEKGGRLDLSRNVEVWNNFNEAEYNLGDVLGSHAPVNNEPQAGIFPGGAIGIYKTVVGETPTLTLGDNVIIHDNCVYGTKQRGAAIFNDNGQINLGSNDRSNLINITRNYLIHNKDCATVGDGGSLSNTDASFVLKDKNTVWPHKNPYNITVGERQVPTKYCFVNLPEYGYFNMPASTLDNGVSTHDKEAKITTKRYDETVEYIPLVVNSLLSNVYLTRTKKLAEDDEIQDAISSLVSFQYQLNPKTRVGITKWFPGLTVRDTIMIASGPVSYPPTADSAFVDEIFFDDSTNAYVFYHNDISPNLIYFQRCATFRQRSTAVERYVNGENDLQGINPGYQDDYDRGDILVEADAPTKFFPNSDSKCSAVLDSLQYRLQGGFYPYTYTWQCSPVSDAGYTTGTSGFYHAAAIDWSTSDADGSQVKTIRHGKSAYKNSELANGTDDATVAKRLAASVDTCVTVQLAMKPTYPQLDYVYRVVGNDLTGNCPMPQEVDIRVVRTESEPFDRNSQPNGAESEKWLDIAGMSIPNPGVQGNLTAHIGVPKKGSANDSTRIRYVRVCKGVHLGVDVVPSFNDGYVTVAATYLQGGFNMDILSETSLKIDGTDRTAELKKEFFCPGDVLNISTLKTKDGNNENMTTSSFMMWDFDPQAPAENVTFTMPDRDYDIRAIYQPQEHWYQVVTSANGSFDVGFGENNKETPGYSVDYNGNVTITNRAGLAWLISTVNGLNYQQAQHFHNKKITIVPYEENGKTYDMSAYLWTPLGTINDPFAGEFDGGNQPISGIICIEDNIPYVGFFGNVGCESPDDVVNGNHNTVENVHLVNPTMKGNNYVGGLVAMVNDGSNIQNNTISGGSLISGSYIVGGLAAQVHGSVEISGNNVQAELLGSAVYAGGLVGEDVENSAHATNNTFCNNAIEYRNSQYRYEITPGQSTTVDGVTTVNGPATISITPQDDFPNGTSSTISLADNQKATIAATTFPVYSIADNGTVTESREDGFAITVCTTLQTGSQYTNNTVHANTVKMVGSGTEGAIANISSENGTKEGFFRRLFGGKSKTAAPQILMANNYVRFRTSGDAMMAGGLVGQANNANLVNNYVYGEVESQNNAGALIAWVGNNVSVERCYYMDGTTSTGAFGGGKRAKSMNDVTSFSGTGNMVNTDNSVGGIHNLTRVLNDWALAQRAVDSSRYESWRSDLENVNNGFPIFGRPDMIRVYDSIIFSECDSFMYNGLVYKNNVVFAMNMVDSSRFLDSTIYFIHKVHNSYFSSVSDSVVSGEGYEGYGFSLTADEIEEMASQFDRHLFRTIELVDSTLSAYGCDSVIVLNLTVYPKVDIDEVEDEPETPAEVAFDVEVYPNPTLGGVTVESVGLESIEVYDAVSRLVIRKNGLEGDSARLDLSGFSTGVYYFRITTQHGVAIKKVIKK